MKESKYKDERSGAYEIMVARQRDAGDKESGTGAAKDKHPAGRAQGFPSGGKSTDKREARTSVRRTLPSPRTAQGRRQDDCAVDEVIRECGSQTGDTQESKVARES